MTQKPRKRKTPADTTDSGPVLGRVVEDVTTGYVTPSLAAIGEDPKAYVFGFEPMTSPEPTDRLSILDDYTGPDGLLQVYVAVSHDAVFAGQRVRVPVTDRVAGLIERGFLEVEPVTPDDPL